MDKLVCWIRLFHGALCTTDSFNHHLADFTHPKRHLRSRFAVDGTCLLGIALLVSPLTTKLESGNLTASQNGLVLVQKKL